MGIHPRASGFRSRIASGPSSIGPSAPELHTIRWELLRDPESPEANLVTQERVIFSRFLDSRDYRNVEVRPDQAMRAVVAVAGPEAGSLKRYEEDGRSLAPWTWPPRWQGAIGARQCRGDAARRGGAGDAGPAPGSDPRRDGHPVSRLSWLDQPAGTRPGPAPPAPGRERGASHVTGRDFVSRLRELLSLPRLVVLASCMSAAPDAPDSATTQDDGALSAVGPEIAAIGVPAVVAMQADVSIATVTQMMPRFFTELRADPEIDRAFSIARSLVQEREDWWVPA